MLATIARMSSAIAPRNPKANREKMTTIMFETFQVKNCYVAIQAVMSLYAAGRTTGLVVDSGDGVSHTVPVFEGFSIPHAVEKMEIAGRVLTEWLQKLLVNHAAENFTSSAEKEIVKNIKEELCYVAQNFDEESKAAQGSSENDKPYTLPDKRVINVGGIVRMSCPELLFKPSLSGMTCASLHELTWKSVQGSDIDIRKDLCKNIILSGGTTMYTGLADRLKSELTNLAPPGAEMKVIASADRKFAVWKGASTFSSLSTFAASWITKADYEEHGAAIVYDLGAAGAPHHAQLQPLRAGLRGREVHATPVEAGVLLAEVVCVVHAQGAELGEVQVVALANGNFIKHHTQGV